MARRKISDVEGIGSVAAEKLLKAGITTTDQLLDAGCDKKGRVKVASLTGLPEKQILKWVNMCDLFRINGVAGQFAELLKASGVDTVKELRNRKPENLVAKMVETNVQKKLTRQVPGVNTVSKWVSQAQELPPKITH